jgi:hypothetical protein
MSLETFDFRPTDALNKVQIEDKKATPVAKSWTKTEV